MQVLYQRHFLGQVTPIKVKYCSSLLSHSFIIGRKNDKYSDTCQNTDKKKLNDLAIKQIDEFKVNN